MRAAEPDRRTWPLSRLRVQHLLYLGVGAYNTSFSYGTFALLHLLAPRLHYLVVLAISHVLGVLNAFVAYRLVVFKVRGHVLRDLFRFWLVYIGSLVFNLVSLPFFVEVVHLPVLVAQAFCVVVAAVSGWIGHKNFSFHRPTDVLEEPHE